MDKIVYGKMLVIITVLLIASVPVLSVLAQDSTSSAMNTVDVEEEASLGILPTNPFYFLKEWGRGLRRAFIFDSIKRAQFELDILDEKAEELEGVSEINENKERNIDLALKNYEDAVALLRLKLEQLDEDSKNPNIEKLLGALAERTAAHQELIARLRERYQQFENLRIRFEQAKGAIDGVVDYALNSVETIQEFRESFRMGDMELREELRVRWQDFRVGVESSGVFNRLDEFESNLRLRLENRLNDK